MQWLSFVSSLLMYQQMKFSSQKQQFLMSSFEYLQLMRRSQQSFRYLAFDPFVSIDHLFSLSFLRQFQKCFNLLVQMEHSIRFMRLNRKLRLQLLVEIQLKPQILICMISSYLLYDRHPRHVRNNHQISLPKLSILQSKCSN